MSVCLNEQLNEQFVEYVLLITSSPRATIAHLRVNKYSHWTKWLLFFFFVVVFFFFFFFFFFFEDLIKIEDAGVATTLKIDFSSVQGQLTPQSRVKSGSNSNSSKMLWLSLFLPRMKKIQLKLKALEWPQYKILIFQTLKGR